MRVHLVENLDEIKSHLADNSNTILDFSEAGELSYILSPKYYVFESIINLDCKGRGNFQVWDEMFANIFQIILFNDPLVMANKIHLWEAMDRAFNTEKVCESIRSFVSWIEKRRNVTNVYILCGRNSFIRKMNF